MSISALTISDGKSPDGGVGTGAAGQPGGGIYNVTLAGNPEIKEKKSNPFRGAKKFSTADLVPGLHVEIKGTGNSSGAIVPKVIRLTQDDFKVAQTMDVRVVPVENRLAETQNRLGETEQNAQRLSGQVQELSAVSNAARGGAKAAQETAVLIIAVFYTARVFRLHFVLLLF